MPVAAITGISNAGIAYQWFSENGKIKHVSEITWGAVQYATVFKRDLFAYDLICLRLRFGFLAPVIWLHLGLDRL